MKFILDENLSNKIAKGLKGFGENVCHVTEEFGKGIKDKELLAKLADGDWIFITNTLNVHTKPQQAIIFKNRNISVIFIDITFKLTGWTWFNFFISRWPKWKELAENNTQPFGFKITMQDIEKLW